MDKLVTAEMTDDEFDVLVGHAVKLNDTELGVEIGDMRRPPVKAAVGPSTSAQVPVAAEPTTKVVSGAALVIASIWLVISILVGMTFINTQAEIYGGDAFTGIQGAMVAATRALGWVIISIGVLGLVTALERQVTKS